VIPRRVPSSIDASGCMYRPARYRTASALLARQPKYLHASHSVISRDGPAGCWTPSCFASGIRPWDGLRVTHASVRLVGRNTPTEEFEIKGTCSKSISRRLDPASARSRARERRRVGFHHHVGDGRCRREAARRRAARVVGLIPSGVPLTTGGSPRDRSSRRESRHPWVLVESACRRFGRARRHVAQADGLRPGAGEHRRDSGATPPEATIEQSARVSVPSVTGRARNQRVERSP
jgi:hypothetical protein